MSLLREIRDLFGKDSGSGDRLPERKKWRKRRRQKGRVRLAAEQLEPRWMLAMFQVTTEIDTIDVSDGQTSLREALIQAKGLAGPDTVTFHSSLANKPVMLGYMISIDDSVTIQGLGASQTVINGQNRSRLFQTAGTVTLDGLMLTGGLADDPQSAIGGAIFKFAGDLTVQNCIISGNSVIGSSGAVGGAILANGSVTVINSTISGNSVIGNFNSKGGGISATEVIVINSTISGNSARGQRYVSGGGISASRVTVTNSTIAGNSTIAATDNNLVESGGGGISADESLIISNSTVSENISRGYVSRGGGLYSNAALMVTNSTITGNNVDRGYEGGEANGGGVFSKIETRIFNSIVAGNGTNQSGNASDLRLTGTTQIVQYSLIGDNTGTQLTAVQVGTPAPPDGNIIGGPGAARIDPLLRPLQNNGGSTRTHALRPNSPAMNAGHPSFSGPLSNDQRGASFDRVSSGLAAGSTPRLDMGAYEFQTFASPLIVDNFVDGDDGNYGVANLSLREAVVLANNIPGPNTISFAPVLADQAILLMSGQITISDPLTIQGLGAGKTIVNGQNNSRLFDITSGAGAVTLDGLTLTGGKTTANSEKGGAVRSASAGQLTIQNSIITANSTIGIGAAGGGIFAATVTITNSTITGNSTLGDSAYGGGIFAQNLVTITNSTVSGNSTIGTNAFGGGIRAVNSVTITNSTISGNSMTGSQGLGGGISSFGSVTVTNSTVTGNSAADGSGGGILAFGSLTVTDSTITSNSVAGTNMNGGGLFSTNGPVTIRNSIVAGNFDSQDGSHPDLRPAGTLTIEFSLIGDNNGTGLSSAPVAMTPNFNLIGGTGAARIDPLLGPLVDNGGPTRTHRPLAGSPVIDAGNNGLAIDPITLAALASDQRGSSFSRIVDGPDPDTTATVDMGAFELGVAPFPLIVTTANDELDAAPNAADLSLREAIQLANGGLGADTITFAAALADQPILLSLSQITISDALTIQGLGAGKTIVNGQNNSRLFDITSGAGAVTLNRLTLTGGKTTANSENGGAVRSASTGQLTILNSTVSGNTTAGSLADGGGIFASGTLSVINSTVSGNTTTGSTSHGGGLHGAGAVTVTGSTISGNSTASIQGSGGGISASGTLTVSNSTISGNSAAANFSHGGGIYAFNSVAVINSTITANSVAGQFSSGGGVVSFNGPVTIRNSMVAGNQNLQGSSHPDLQQYNNGPPIVDYSLIGDNTGSGLAESQTPDATRHNLVGKPVAAGGAGIIDPLLGTLANNGGSTLTHALMPGSKALNAGDPGFVAPPNTDQRGAPFVRVALGRIDMGAFEDQATFTVNSTADSPDASPGDGLAKDANGNTTLRAALQEANASVSSQTIQFNIPGSGVKTISPTTALPSITDRVIIDATTQPGYISTPLIQLAGNLAGAGVNGLTIAAGGGGSTIKGLAINRFTAAGIRLTGGGSNVIVGNFIGTNTAGTGALANETSGVFVVNSANNVIGGILTVDRNVLSGNSQYGVYLSGAGSTGNVIQGNRIGTNLAGTADLGNKLSGVLVSGASSNTIGGTVTGARNFISGNDQYGVFLNGSGATGNLIQGNYIGTNAAGTAAVTNSIHGIYINQSPGNTIGGTVIAARNVISGNTQSGVYLNGSGATGNLVQRNYIGTDRLGSGMLGNGLSGVVISSATLNTIGGASAWGNTIAFNAQSGVQVLGTASRNAIQGNSVFDNVGLGIDLGGNGLTPNDTDDADTGPNKLQNFPVISAAVLSGLNINFTYSIPSVTPNSVYPLTVEFYIADSGGQEGKTYLGKNTYASSSATLSKTVLIPKGSAVLGSKLVATATDAQGNTSEFSASVTAANALQATGSENVCFPVGASTELTQSQLQPIVTAAITRLSAQGLTSAQRVAISSVSFAIANLPGALLGLAAPQVITLDATAAGYGWFIDETPLDDKEFVSGSPLATFDARTHMDLLTAVMHELGHVLGHDDLDANSYSTDLMSESLSVGIRHTTLAEAVDAVFSRT